MEIFWHMLYPINVVRPHTRGVYGQCFGNHHKHVRFIPTHVGYTYALMVCSMDFSGSSPHTWGIPQPAHPPQERFIPTHVGYTKVFLTPFVVTTGSSPHTWGIHGYYNRCPPCISVHPHTCGAYNPIPFASRYCSGSSPHMWGIRK